MKKILVMFGCIAFMAACSSSESEQEGEEYYSNSTSENELSAATRQSEVDTSINDIGTDRTATVPAATDSYEKGKNLIATSDCLSCHQVDKKLVGPSYQEVAAKYAFNDENVNMLAGKIINGGAGNWGQIPMTPHPDLSQENAQEMAKYVLSLKK
ncbi:c-type cytochrome [Pontibacter sp. CAU 1760]